MGASRGDQDWIPPRGESSKAKELLDLINSAYDNNRAEFERWERNRQYWRGRVGADGKAGLVRTNVIYSTMATILPQIYAKAPDISVSPAPSVSQEGESYGLIKDFCETLESVLRIKLVNECKLKRIGKAAVRSAMTTGIAWVKVIFEEKTAKDPVVMQQLNDAQDNLRRVRALASRLRKPESIADNERLQEELKQTIAGLMEKAEIVINRGLVIDRPLSEDVVLLDETINDFNSYTQASAIAHRIWLDADRFEELFGFRPTKATEYSVPRATREIVTHSDRKSEKKYYCVYEVWSKTDNRVYTVCDGFDGYVRDPFTPPMLGERFYPFFALGFNLVDGQFYPMSDVELLTELQDEYNTTRTNFAEHRKESLPVRIVRAGGSLDAEDIRRIQNRKINEIIVVKGAGGRPLTEDMFEFPNTPIDPSVYDTLPIRADIDMVSGATDAARGAVFRAKTATEAQILQAGLSSRTEERRDAIEDWITEIAIYAAEMLLQRMTADEVKAIVGEKAQWPRMTKDDIFRMVQIEVRGGSTGKPNALQDQERWMKMMPILQDAMVKIMELRAQGQTDMADAVIELVRETVRRFDERIDLDDFIPPTQSGNDALAQLDKIDPRARQVAQKVILDAQAKQAQMQQQLQDLQERLAQAEDRGRVEAARIESQERMGAEDRAMRERIEMERLRMDSASREAERQREYEKVLAEISSRDALEREKIASNERIAIAKAFADASARVLASRAGALQADQVGTEREQTMAAIQALVEQMQEGFSRIASAIGQQAPYTAPQH